MVSSTGLLIALAKRRRWQEKGEWEDSGVGSFPVGALCLPVSVAVAHSYSSSPQVLTAPLCGWLCCTYLLCSLPLASISL